MQCTLFNTASHSQTLKILQITFVFPHGLESYALRKAHPLLLSEPVVTVVATMLPYRSVLLRRVRLGGCSCRIGPGSVAANTERRHTVLQC